MGLPHVLVRFYTNPDGRAARRTTLIVIALLGLFYVFTPVYGVLGRVYLPDPPGRHPRRRVPLLLPAASSRAARRPPVGGARRRRLRRLPLHRLGADHLGGRRHRPGPLARTRPALGGDLPRIRTFRLAAVVAVVVPYAVSWLALNTSLADTVGLAFAVAASTFCPLLVLGVWWRRLSVAGAAAGLVTGGVLALGATTVTVLGGPGARRRLARRPLAQPAAWTVPTAFLVAVLVSYATPGSIPAAPRAPWSACTPRRTSGPARPAPADADPLGASGSPRSAQAAPLGDRSPLPARVVFPPHRLVHPGPTRGKARGTDHQEVRREQRCSRTLDHRRTRVAVRRGPGVHGVPSLRASSAGSSSP